MIVLRCRLLREDGHGYPYGGTGASGCCGETATGGSSSRHTAATAGAVIR